MSVQRDAFGHAISFGVTVRVKGPRKDGKYLARFTYASTGRTIGSIMFRKDLDAYLATHPDYTVQGYARPIVLAPHADVSARAASDAHAHMMHHPCTDLRVFYLPTVLDAAGRIARPGNIRAMVTADGAADAGEWLPAWPERVPSSLSCAQLIAWFAARSGSVPYRGGGL